MNKLQNALDSFSLSYSILTKDTVNSTFRMICKENHPDVSPTNGFDLDLLKTQRDLLLEQCEYVGEIDKLQRIRKVTRDEVFMTNKVFCEMCDGYGETEERIMTSRYRFQSCTSCNETGTVHKIIRCNRCEDGKIIMKDGNVVECKICEGTGIFKHFKRKCSDCGGTGIKRVILESPSYFSKCYDCNGEGYTKIKNPIFKSETLF